MNTEKHYGIKFRSNCEIEHESRKQMARLLFLNPEISGANAKLRLKIFEIYFSDEKAIYLLQSYLDMVTDLDCFSKKRSLKKVKGKLRRWIKSFTFPTVTELKELAEFLDLSYDKVWAIVMDELYSSNLPLSKIITFLNNYGKQQGNEELIDEWLDLYNFNKGLFADKQLRLTPFIIEEFSTFLIKIF